MKHCIIIAFLCLGLAANAQYNYDNLELSKNTGEGITYKNLRLYPITAKTGFTEANKNIGNYTTLKKALEEKKVTITEGTGVQQYNNSPNLNNNSSNQLSYSGESVNTLYIENVSNDTVIVLAGEVVKGGKQDRVLGQDMLLLPKSGKKDISVFCVEHGRWHYENGSKEGFNKQMNVSSMNVRKAAVVKKDQSQVWQEVEVVTSNNNAKSSSGTYNALESSEEYKKNIEGYINYFTKEMAARSNVIGVVVCTGDKVIGVDMFATPALFNAQFPSLLYSYATEAITSGSAATVSPQKAKEFLDKILADEAKQQIEVSKSGTILMNKGKKIHISYYL